MMSYIPAAAASLSSPNPSTDSNSTENMLFNGRVVLLGDAPGDKNLPSQVSGQAFLHWIPYSSDVLEEYDSLDYFLSSVNINKDGSFSFGLDPNNQMKEDLRQNANIARFAIHLTFEGLSGTHYFSREFVDNHWFAPLVEMSDVEVDDLYNRLGEKDIPETMPLSELNATTVLIDAETAVPAQYDNNFSRMNVDAEPEVSNSSSSRPIDTYCTITSLGNVTRWVRVGQFNNLTKTKYSWEYGETSGASTAISVLLQDNAGVFRVGGSVTISGDSGAASGNIVTEKRTGYSSTNFKFAIRRFNFNDVNYSVRGNHCVGYPGIYPGEVRHLATSWQGGARVSGSPSNPFTCSPSYSASKRIETVANETFKKKSGTTHKIMNAISGLGGSIDWSKSTWHSSKFTQKWTWSKGGRICGNNASPITASRVVVG